MKSKQHILILHGGSAFETYEEYLTYLKEKDITLDALGFKDWKQNLSETLGEDFKVVFPKMPNAQNARYEEWKIWFERILPLLKDDVIIVGHSLGAIFIVKYLSENKSLRKIKATLLVGAPYNTPKRHPLVDFNLTKSLEKFIAQAGKITLFHSKDDMVVPISNLKYYIKDLPDAAIRIYNNRGHFNDATFPEIVRELKKLRV